MAKSRINLNSSAGDAGPPASQGPAAVPSTGRVWAGQVQPWPGSAMDLQKQRREAGGTGSLPPGSAAIPSTGAASAGPIPVTIAGPLPVPVSVVGGAGGRGGGGQLSAPRRRPLIPRLERAGLAAAGAAGLAGRGLAQNDPNQLLGSVAIASRGLAMLGPAGAAAAAGITVMTASLGAVKATVDAFVQRGRELSGLNAGLASSTARADVTRLKSDIREADQLGPQMSRLIENQAKAEAAFREFLLPIKNFILNVLNKALEFGMEVLDGILSGVQGILEAVKAIPGVGLLIGNEMLDQVKAIRKQLQGDPEAKGADLLGPLLDKVINLEVPEPGPAQLPPVGALGVPIVGGVL